eukprot:8493679-Pyramimonas_sp.AAC.1
MRTARPPIRSDQGEPLWRGGRVSQQGRGDARVLRACVSVASPKHGACMLPSIAQHSTSSSGHRCASQQWR